MPDRDRRNQRENLSMEDALSLLGFDAQTTAAGLQRAQQVYEQVYGSRPDRWSPEQEMEYMAAASRVQELSQPSQRPQAIRRAPASEFSVDVGGLHQGLIDLVGGMQDAQRREELFRDPQVQASMAADLTQSRNRVEELNQLARQVEGGELPGEAMRYMDADDVFRPESVASRLREEAQRVQDEVSGMEREIRRTGGALFQLQSLEGERERAAAERDFRSQFIDTFGQEAMQTARKYIEDRQTAQERESLEDIRQRGMMNRLREQQRLITERQRERFQSERERDRDVTGPGLLPSPHRPATTKVVVSGARDMVSEGIEDLRRAAAEQYVDTQSFDTRGRSREERIQAAIRDGSYYSQMTPAMTQALTQYSEANSLLRQIEVSAERFETLEFPEGELPPKRPPSSTEQALLERMESNPMISQELIDNWMEYNRVDLYAPPVPREAPQGYAPGDYTIPTSGSWQRGQGPVINQ